MKREYDEEDSEQEDAHGKYKDSILDLNRKAIKTHFLRVDRVPRRPGVIA